MKKFDAMDIAIIGGGGHARSVMAILKKHPDFNLLGYTDIRDNGEILGIPYLGKDDFIFQNKIENVVVGVSYLKSPLDMQLRFEIIEKCQRKGVKFPTIISPDAIVDESVQIEEGTVVFSGAVVNVGTTIGAFSIINTRSVIDHDCCIGNNCSISPGAVLCGAVTIDDRVFVGAGTVVKDSVSIGEDILIGTQSNVVKNLTNKGVYFGNPAKLIRTI